MARTCHTDILNGRGLWLGGFGVPAVPKSVQKRRGGSGGERGRLAARSLDLPARGAGLLEEFFRPLDALGSEPGLMARWLAGVGIREDSRVLDLGCGKGAVAIGVARATGCFVTGVDAFEPFVWSCRGLAAVRGVGSRCDFRVGLAERFRAEPFDAVVLLNLFPFERAVPIARRRTRPGGFYLIDDAVAIGTEQSPFPTARDVGEAIAAAGDRVERCKIWTKAEVRERERRNYALLRSNARALMKATPKNRALLTECLARMKAGIADLSSEIRPACWLVRRGRR
mgnify:CR=1 FL=1